MESANVFQTIIVPPTTKLISLVFNITFFKRNLQNTESTEANLVLQPTNEAVSCLFVEI